LQQVGTKPFAPPCTVESKVENGNGDQDQCPLRLIPPLPRAASTRAAVGDLIETTASNLINQSVRGA
jgi:hypothetical protein